MTRISVALGAAAIAAVTFAAGCGAGNEQPATGEGDPAVTDADVSVEFYMAAMPSMKMPEMRNRVDLVHEGGGRYRGTGNVIMGGEWDVTVTARRGGEEIARRTLDVTAQQ